MNNLNALASIVFRDADKIIVQGRVTIDNVVKLTQDGIALFDDHPLTIDLDKVTEVDSTIISMLLEWLRATRKNTYSLQFINMPESLNSLIQLYDVVELFPVSIKPQVSALSDQAKSC